MPFEHPKAKSILNLVTKHGTQVQSGCLESKDDVIDKIEAARRNTKEVRLKIDVVQELKNGDILANQEIVIWAPEVAFYTVMEVIDAPMIQLAKNGIISIDDIKKDKRVQ